MAAQPHYNDILEDEWVPQVSAMLGGAKVLGGSIPKNRLEVHAALTDGLPNKAAVHLVEGLHLIPLDDALNVIGFAARSWQRHKGDAKGHLNAERSSRAWKFAEILARAIKVLGSQEQAERWLDQPATGLNRQRPVDLLRTQTGTELVEEFLERLEYGVYT
jgi:putative toxin-antitoxin system antitoxin component (TIGR02293 family)